MGVSSWGKSCGAARWRGALVAVVVVLATAPAGRASGPQPAPPASQPVPPTSQPPTTAPAPPPPLPATPAPPPTAPLASSGRPWVLTFDDEFDATGLDPTHWSNGFGWGLTAAHENGYCDPANSYVKDGILVQRTTNLPQGGMPYSAACISTKHKFSQLYGYWEVRMRVAAGQGLHSAFWAKPENEWWPPELDVEEIAGGLTNQVTTTVHWLECGVHLSQNHDFSGPDFSQDYHVFGAEWTPSGTTWYVDGVEVFRTSAGTAHMAEQGPLYMILNLQTNLAGGERTDTSTPSPSYQYIDYVRVWVRPPPQPPAGGQPPPPPPPVCPQPPPAPPGAGGSPPPVPPGAGGSPPPGLPGAGGSPPALPGAGSPSPPPVASPTEASRTR